MEAWKLCGVLGILQLHVQIFANINLRGFRLFWKIIVSSKKSTIYILFLLLSWVGVPSYIAIPNVIIINVGQIVTFSGWELNIFNTICTAFILYRKVVRFEMKWMELNVDELLWNASHLPTLPLQNFLCIFGTSHCLVLCDNKFLIKIMNLDHSFTLRNVRMRTCERSEGNWFICAWEIN